MKKYFIELDYLGETIRIDFTEKQDLLDLIKEILEKDSVYINIIDIGYYTND